MQIKLLMHSAAGGR